MTDFLASFLDDCRQAVREGPTATLEHVQSALNDPDRFHAAIRARAKPWFFVADETLTVFCTEGRPGSASAPHDHGTWSVLGCYAGAEESWWHNNETDPLTTTGHSLLRRGEAHQLPADAIHTVMNRWDTPNAVVHVYAGNFLATDRHVWDPISSRRHPAPLAEPHAPLDGPSNAAPTEPTLGVTRPPIAGMAFAALSATNVEATTRWLTDTLGFVAFVDETQTCAADEQFTYLLEPTSLTAIGVHHGHPGLDHIALRIPSIDALEQWHQHLTQQEADPAPITPWNNGTFTEISGPDGLRIRLLVPVIR